MDILICLELAKGMKNRSQKPTQLGENCFWGIESEIPNLILEIDAFPLSQKALSIRSGEGLQ